MTKEMKTQPEFDDTTSFNLCEIIRNKYSNLDSNISFEELTKLDEFILNHAARIRKEAHGFLKDGFDEKALLKASNNNPILALIMTYANILHIKSNVENYPVELTKNSIFSFKEAEEALKLLVRSGVDLNGLHREGFDISEESPANRNPILLLSKCGIEAYPLIISLVEHGADLNLMIGGFSVFKMLKEDIYQKVNNPEERNSILTSIVVKSKNHIEEIDLLPTDFLTQKFSELSEKEFQSLRKNCHKLKSDKFCLIKHEVETKTSTAQLSEFSSYSIQTQLIGAPRIAQEEKVTEKIDEENSNKRRKTIPDTSPILEFEVSKLIPNKKAGIEF